MGWAQSRTGTVWIVRRKSTKNIIAVYDRKYEAELHTNHDPTCEWIRWSINYTKNNYEHRR